MAPEVGAVGEGFIINLEDYIVNIVYLFNISAKRNIIGDFPNSRVVVGNTKLAFRAAHTVRGKARDSRRGNFVSLYRAAACSESNLHSLPYVRSTANDINKLASVINLEKMKLF